MDIIILAMLIKVLELSGLEIIDASIATSINKDIAANTFITKFVLERLGIATNIDLHKLYNLAKIFPTFFKDKKIKYSNPFCALLKSPD